MTLLYSTLIVLALLVSCQKEGDGTFIRGIYGSPAPFWSRGMVLQDLAVNAVFVHSGSLNRDMVARVKKEGARIFAEFPTLNGEGYVETHPEAWPVNEKGEREKPASWFMGVCPTDEGFRQYRSNQLRELLRKYDLDGIWIDYVHWHAQFEAPEPILPETCFCNRCVSIFQDWASAHVPEGPIPVRSSWILDTHDREWRDWRCRIIAGWATDLKRILLEEKPGALFGMYHCPWTDEEFKGARRRILGIDFDMLKGTIDVFSPMVYHARMGRSPQWVKENLEWFCKMLGIAPGSRVKVWPIVQAYNDPVSISSMEFGTVLSHGMSAGATGVMMFTSYAVAEDRDKTETMKKAYSDISK